MRDKQRDYSIEEWQSLTFDVKRDIWNHVWNCYSPEIGFKTKVEIVNHLVKTTKLDAIQYGIKCFGWGDYQLYVIVADSKTRVPSNFLDLTINKGILQNYTKDKKAIVKFNYGGLQEIDLTEKVKIM